MGKSLFRLSVLAALLVTLGGLAPRVEDGIWRSQVIDSDTRRPVSGVVALLERTYACGAFHGTHWYYDPPVESVTDPDGRFVVGEKPRRPPCDERWEWVGLIAPGYLPTRGFHSAPTPLPRLRHTIERDAYFSKEAGSHPSRPGPLYERALGAARNLPFTAVGSVGVFVSQPGSEFDRILVAPHGFGYGPRLTVVAQDRRAGALYSWTTRGDRREPPVLLPEGTTLVEGIGPQGFPVLGRDGHIYFPNKHQGPSATASRSAEVPCPRGRCDRATRSANGKAAGERVLRNAAFRRTGRPSLGDRQVLTLASDSSFKVTERL